MNPALGGFVCVIGHAACRILGLNPCSVLTTELLRNFLWVPLVFTHISCPTPSLSWSQIFRKSLHTLNSLFCMGWAICGGQSSGKNHHHHHYYKKILLKAQLGAEPDIWDHFSGLKVRVLRNGSLSSLTWQQ